jgi:predicted nucleic acid-binding protein
VVVGPFLDTTVLLGGLIELGPSVEGAQDVMAAVAEGRVRRPTTAWHCCLEFYAVATRLPEEFRVAPKDALQLLEREVLGRFRVLELDPEAGLSFLAGAAQQRVAGGRIYDAHIGEIARRARARIVVTDNVRHFSGLAREGCRVLDCATFASELAR